MTVAEQGKKVLESAVRNADGCLLSIYSVGSHGYAQASWWEDGKSHGTTAHRAVWIYLYGDPGELVVDHKHNCSKLCVEPEHLQLLTLSQNTSKGRGTVIGCRNGHHPGWWRRAGKKHRCHGCAVERQRKRDGQIGRVDYTKEPV